MPEHLLPGIKQYDSKCAAKLIEILFAGGEFFISDCSVQPVGKLQDLVDIKGQQVEHKKDK